MEELLPMKNITYSEKFISMQGEGEYTGIPTLWVRFYLCNLQCRGFGQKDPTDPSTYDLSHENVDLNRINTIDELPIFPRGCDSAYSVAKKYKHLMHNESVEEVVDGLTNLMINPHNPAGLFWNTHSYEETHFAFTGGEPMLNQESMVAIMNEFAARDNCPAFVTVETNGTRAIKEELEDMIDAHKTTDEYGGLVQDTRGRTEWFWSVSPKLHTVSGELNKRAIKPEVVEGYAKVSNHGQLKFVVNGTDECWEELERVVSEFREVGVDWPVWVMPVGATVEQQSETEIGDIANEAIRRGYRVAARVHAYLWGNTVGV